MRLKAAGAAKKPERICVIVKGQSWESPQEGRACTSLRHSHMTRGKVETLIADGKMEYVAGERDGSRVWIPVAQFVKSRCWRKTMSVGDGPPVATMQLVAGG